MAKKVPEKIEKFVHECRCQPAKSGGSSAVYGLGLLGSLLYFLQGSVTVSDYILAFVKAIFWPAILAYQAFTLLGL